MSRTKLQPIGIDSTFICENCGLAVPPLPSGGVHRNHCPYCLSSKHVDLKSGDRRSACRGIMDPVGVWVKENRDWALLHRCRRCGFIRANRIAADDSEKALFLLAATPMSALPYPAERTLGALRRENGLGENN